MIHISSIRLGHDQRKILKELYKHSERRGEGWSARRSLLYSLDVQTTSESCSFGRAINLLIREGLIESGTFYEYYLDCLDREPTDEDHEYALEVAYDQRSKECYYRITAEGVRKYDSLPALKKEPKSVGKSRHRRTKKKVVAFTPRAVFGKKSFKSDGGPDESQTE